MKRNRSSVSKARSYAELGEYWDKHDLSDVWAKTKRVKFDVVLEPEATYYAVKKDLSKKIQLVAREHKISGNALINLWLEQKIKERRPSRRSGKLAAKNA
jgi:hypothetical protein